MLRIARNNAGFGHQQHSGLSIFVPWLWGGGQGEVEGTLAQNILTQYSGKPLLGQTSPSVGLSTSNREGGMGEGVEWGGGSLAQNILNQYSGRLF